MNKNSGVPLHYPERIGLYDPSFEHDSCGTGFVADIKGRRSHAILEKAVQCVVNLTHRGALIGDTGDGAGITTQIPHKFFTKELKRLGKALPNDGELGVGMIFFPHDDPDATAHCRTIIEGALKHYGLDVLAWRAVPVDRGCLGKRARDTVPVIEQVLIKPGNGVQASAFERTLYLVRKRIERKVGEAGIRDFYIPSFSSRTLVYKGLLVATQLKTFYKDLNDPDYETALALFHQRYSTNTFPNWFLAQPFRYLGHNGEINTLLGNRNWMRAREPELAASAWGDRIDELKPLVWSEGSDSASLDNALEALVLSGRNILHSMMMLVPEAWENMATMNPVWKAFYQYHACFSEPWDGPAALAFTDGRIVGAALDRNGLRPARYIVTEDGLIMMGSEVGCIEIPDATVIEKGRLGPGKMIAVDTESGVFMHDEEIKSSFASKQPYGAWLKEELVHLPKAAQPHEPRAFEASDLLRRQIAFGYTSEEMTLVIEAMAMDAKEPVGSMGDDTPLAVLSQKPRNIYTYLKQLFAQVTNPPIDPYREELVMSLKTFLGPRHSIFEEAKGHAHLIELETPILTDHEMEEIRKQKDPAFASTTLAAVFDAGKGPQGLEEGILDLCRQASRAVDEGRHILILTDTGIDERRAPIPMALAVGAVHHHLIREGKRMKASIIAEAGDVREIHHACVLLGYGASAIHPYLAYETIRGLIDAKKLQNISLDQALKNYKKSAGMGIFKIMSKMGISCVSSYTGAQIFEAIGLNDEVIQTCFAGTASRVGGVGFEAVAEDVLAWHSAAFFPKDGQELEIGGYYRYRHQGEYHAFSPDVVRTLHEAVRTANYEKYKEFSKHVESRPPTCLRDLFRFKKTRPRVPVEDVEPLEDIRKRFCSQGMSHGALSRETHEALAIAMNRIGGKSSSGEGGEDPSRYKPYPNGDWGNSPIKQVASGRFGVTPEYLVNCNELEIKIAQGSKPGEGGQLPGHKVTAEIAFLRHAVPGISLISPPPHHDIYSIEDLKQLIYDLKMVNPKAWVSVKLVAEVGVGTIAAGVAKGHADSILISGHDGGTGASPLSSIKNAGSPWEIGLAETQQVLVLNDLRGRVNLRTDGGIKTGRDVVIAAMMGAEEYGFGTAGVVALGCCMVRACHLNTCPVGVATQNEKLRAKFTGKPEYMVNFMTYVAMEVREILASLGFKKLGDVIGRTDLLEQVAPPGLRKVGAVDLSALLANVDPKGERPRTRQMPRNDFPDTPLDDQIIQDARAAIEGKGSVQLTYAIRNIDRTVGARLAGAIALRYGNKGLPEGAIDIRFEGTAGQSFGAFNINGVRLTLVGQANDYVGKGMHGGEIAVLPSPDAKFAAHENVIMGNTVMYGATGGTLYVAGCAGERFAVRNSGGRAVVEGLGDHGCEYMTGGVIVVLGSVGRNFGAGMTGGLAFVFDEEKIFEKLYNPQLIRFEPLVAKDDVDLVRSMIERHARLSESPRAMEILKNWPRSQSLFWRVFPQTTESKVNAGETMVKPEREIKK